MSTEVLFLGTGTSTGVPMLGCGCPACTSLDPRDSRTRASLLVRRGGRELVVDTTPEFRIQMLRAGAGAPEGVLLTHSHADHVHGFDDLRQYSLVYGYKMPVYGSPQTLDWIRRHFSYIWDAPQVGGGLPNVELCSVTGTFTAAGMCITPLPVKHGGLDVYGYRIGPVAYISDVSYIPPETEALLQDLDVLILDAVRYKPHHTHLNLQQALDAVAKLRPRFAYLTHMNHDFVHRLLEQELPEGVAAAYDGLRFSVQY